MAHSPLSLSEIESALKKARIDGRWYHSSFDGPSYNAPSYFSAANGAGFKIEHLDKISLYGPNEARKSIVSAIWSYKPPKEKPSGRTRLKNLERLIRKIKKDNRM
jgi:hypothetical protein